MEKLPFYRFDTETILKIIKTMKAEIVKKKNIFNKSIMIDIQKSKTTIDLNEILFYIDSSLKNDFLVNNQTTKNFVNGFREYICNLSRISIYNNRSYVESS